MTMYLEIRKVTIFKTIILVTQYLILTMHMNTCLKLSLSLGGFQGLKLILYVPHVVNVPIFSPFVVTLQYLLF